MNDGKEGLIGWYDQRGWWHDGLKPLPAATPPFASKRRWRARLEWKPADCWVGAFWRNDDERLDIWVCVVPMIPIHLTRLAQEVLAL